MSEARRTGREDSTVRAAILDAAEAVMVEQGYAAVSARGVAQRAAIKPALLQYYFPAMEELLLAVYRRAAERSLARQAEALASTRPAHALWALALDPARTTLAVEFMALANHRKSIRTEIARVAERSRAMQAEALAGLLPPGRDGRTPPADGVALLLAGAARALVMEQALGITAGHDAAAALVEALLDALP